MALVVVNATAARASGALTILNQFIDNIPAKTDDDFSYLFMIYHHLQQMKTLHG